MGSSRLGGRARFAQCKVGIPPRRLWRCTEMDALLGSLSCGHHAQLGQCRDSGRRCEASQLTLSAAVDRSDPEPPRAAARTLRKVGSRCGQCSPSSRAVSNDVLGGGAMQPSLVRWPRVAVSVDFRNRRSARSADASAGPARSRMATPRPIRVPTYGFTQADQASVVSSVFFSSRWKRSRPSCPDARRRRRDRVIGRGRCGQHEIGHCRFQF